MKYSIISTANNEYRQFAYVFLRSAIDNLDLDNIHEICILDTGLSDYDHEKLSSLHPKINLIKASNKITSERSWDSGWHAAVLNKTTFAYEYLKTNRIPTCLIDIDSMFVKDFYDIILNNKNIVDIIVCDRSEDYSPSPCIASFVGFLHIDNSIKFIEDWKDTMNSITGFLTKETPALNKLISTNQYNIAGLSYRIIGLFHESRLVDNTRIIHFKGGGTENLQVDEAILLRFNRFPKYSNTILNYIQNV